MSTPAAVLQSLRSRGVVLWSNDDQLFYKAPVGVLQPPDIEFLRLHKQELLALVGIQVENPPRLGPRTTTGPVPLTFSQLLQWRWIQSGERQPMRHMTSATRLRGALSVEAVQQSVVEVVRRHEVLRTRIFLQDGVPVQEADELRTAEVGVSDLQNVLPDEQGPATRRLIEKIILERCDIGSDSMFVARLLRLASRDYVLVLAMEHIISDARSRNLLLQDVLAIYAEKSGGRSRQLPHIDVQFLDYAAWQRSHQQRRLERNLSFCLKRLRGCHRLTFPEGVRSTVDQAGWGSVPLVIEDELSVQLRRWCKQRRTTPAMATLTAFVGSVLLWYRVADAVVLYQSDGRFFPQIEKTIGCFASTLYLRVGFCGTDSWIDLLSRVTQEYCVAYDHADQSLMETLVPGPEILANPSFNWVTPAEASDSQNSAWDGRALRAEPLSFENPVLGALDMDSEPQLLLRDGSARIVGAIHFPRKKYSHETVAGFAGTFVVCLHELIMNSEGWVSGLALR